MTPDQNILCTVRKSAKIKRPNSKFDGSPMPFPKNLIPEDYRDLFAYISPKAFKVMDWRGALKACFEDIRTSHDSAYMLWPTREKATQGSPLKSSVADLGEDEKKRIGESILEIYFYQLRAGGAVALDLRLKHFSLDDSGQLVWHQAGVRHQFDETFRKDLLDCYHGFYGGNDQLMEKAAESIGLWPAGSDQATKDRGMTLLKQHFGDTSAAVFDLNKFRQSFHELFTFLVETGSRLDHEFLFLGVYLLTLYHGLASFSVPFDVAKVWEISKPDP